MRLLFSSSSIAFPPNGAARSILLLLFVVTLQECSAGGVMRDASPDSASVGALPFAMNPIPLPQIPARMFDIRTFGAREGEKNTAAIQAAIDSAARSGGGIVVVPAGTWLTGAIRLADHINLRIEKNAVLLFSQDVRDYLPAVFSRHEDIECYKYSAFIYASGVSDIAITGEGTLNGQGKPWWAWKERKTEVLLYEMGDRNVPVKERLFDGTNGNELRPAFFQPMNCRNILVEGVTFLYGAFWTITPTYCDNVVVRRVHIVTEGEYGHTPNGDGVDPSSCSNVLIEECTFDTGDDCIAIKSGRDADGLRIALPTENIVVRNCTGMRGHGGIVIGSETSGGVRNIFAANCRFSGTDRIVRIKSARGRGGILENMWFRDLRGERIKDVAIHVNMLYTGTRLPAVPAGPATPVVRNLNFENIVCASGESYAVEILGLPEMPASNMAFTGIQASSAKGVNISDAKGITFTQCSITAAKAPVVAVTDGANITIDGATLAPSSSGTVRIEGEKSQNITFRKSNLRNPESDIILGPGATRAAFRIEE